eukprot:5965790-Amphidinium_carterae.1
MLKLHRYASHTVQTTAKRALTSLSHSTLQQFKSFVSRCLVQETSHDALSPGDCRHSLAESRPTSEAGGGSVRDQQRR